jgi:hypothetical protein
MNHDDIRHKLSDYIDGAVSAKEKTEIEEHLKACTKCSDALAELRKTIEQVKQVEDVEPPVWMTQRIMAKVREESERRAGIWNKLLFPLRMSPAISAVAVLFLAVTAFYIYQNIRPERKYAKTPVESFAKKEAPSAGMAQDKVGKAGESRLPAKQAPQAPEYKSLDMKYAFEKPAPPVPKEQASEPAAAAPAPAAPAEKLIMHEDAARIRGMTATEAPGAEVRQEVGKVKTAPAMTMRQEQAARSMGLVAKEEAKPAAACLSYEPDVVSVYGIIREKDFPGPPNYESIARGDRRETSWILTLDKTVCVTGKGGDALDEQEANVSEMQLVLDSAGYAKYRGLLMKPVAVRGTLFHAHTGHHRTRVLLTVLDITERQ